MVFLRKFGTVFLLGQNFQNFKKIEKISGGKVPQIFCLGESTPDIGAGGKKYHSFKNKKKILQMCVLTG